MSIFLTSGHGLTSSEANHIANVIAERVKDSARQLSLMTTITRTVFVDGQTLTAAEANFDADAFLREAAVAPRVYQLSAWLREAVRERDRLLHATEVTDCPAHLLTDFTKAMPEPAVTQSNVQCDWGIEQLDVKQRARYMSLEAEAAAYGKLLHADGVMQKLRDEQTATGVQWVTGPDRKAYPASVTVDVAMQTSVNAIFFKLQQRHREVSKHLNAIKQRVNAMVSRENVARRSAAIVAKEAHAADTRTWHEERRAVANANATISAEWRKSQVLERARIAALKIEIPGTLQALLDEVRAYEKEM